MSISCDGVCLTLISLKSNYLEFYLSNETLNRSKFKNIKINDKINLETPLKYGQKISGHICQGHVDTVGKLASIKKIDKSFLFEFYVSRKDKKQLVEKASISINGISLTISKITKTAEKLEAEVERSPNEDEIGRNLEMTTDEVTDAMRISRRHHSLNAPFRDGDKNSLIDVIEDDGQIEPDEPLMAESLKDEIRQSLDTLKERERQVIKMYFGIDRDYALTLNEIGEEFSLTRERVRQIKEKAIRRLRHRSRSKSLRTYLG